MEDRLCARLRMSLNRDRARASENDYHHATCTLRLWFHTRIYRGSTSCFAVSAKPLPRMSLSAFAVHSGLVFQSPISQNVPVDYTNRLRKPRGVQQDRRLYRAQTVLPIPDLVPCVRNEAGNQAQGPRLIKSIPQQQQPDPESWTRTRTTFTLAKGIRPNPKPASTRLLYEFSFMSRANPVFACFELSGKSLTSRPDRGLDSC